MGAVVSYSEKDGQVGRRCMKCGQPSGEFSLCWRCHNRVEGSVSVRASLAEIEALGPQRAKAFLEGIAKVIGANK
jgi:hypothetical protein